MNQALRSALYSLYCDTKPEVLEIWGKKTGFKIVYLPNLIKSLANKQVLLYRTPYLNLTDLTNLCIGNVSFFGILN